METADVLLKESGLKMMCLNTALLVDVRRMPALSTSDKELSNRRKEFIEPGG
jgi:hypothetical protein